MIGRNYKEKCLKHGPLLSIVCSLGNPEVIFGPQAPVYLGEQRFVAKVGNLFSLIGDEMLQQKAGQAT